ncbi:MAG: AAA family ATPase [Gemmatimonadetes bacterium]|nr:AAA family ATPase [Gemmatimonadota bacterium]
MARLLARAPAVVLTGPRQVGKTTVALEFVREWRGTNLDLEDPRDRAKLTDVHKYCERNADRLVVLDEIQRAAGLFEPLRGIIDQRRRESRRTGHFLLLGSASIDLLRQTGETLAGRVAYCEMQPVNVREASDTDTEDLWHRGDALLGIDSYDALLGHPVAGGSWEGFVIENILSGMPAHVSYAYYRSTGGAEIDLVLELGGGEVWAVGIKRSSAPKVSRGFHTACDDVRPDRRLVVHGGDESYPLRDGIEAVTLVDLCAELGAGQGQS